MGIQLKPEKISYIKEEFEALQTREDLLKLLNTIAEMQDSFYKPGIKLAPVGRLDITNLLQDFGLPVSKRYSPDTKSFITQKQLHFFSSSFEGKEKKRTRYVSFQIRKKSGSLREIKAPLPKLKEIQRAVNTLLQTVYTMQEEAYGFVPGKSIVDNARVHAGASFVLNIDIKDFFPSVHFRRIKLMLEKPPFNLSGEKEPLAFLIANLCTDDGVLPQGAPTSPLLTNIICQRLDRRLKELAGQYKAAYSRYADDISFSCNEYIFTSRFMQRLEKILKDDRFEMNTEKTRIQGKAFRQEVTGLTVNQTVNVSRQFLRSYRTLLHLYRTKGALKALDYHRRRMPASVISLKLKNEIKNPDVYMEHVIMGKYYFMCMVKGKSELQAPFVKEPNPKMKIIASLNIKDLTFTFPSDPEKEELVDDQMGFIDDSMAVVVRHDELNYNPLKKENSAKGSLIEKILYVWEKDADDNGFKLAMEILKQQSNEQ